ncbi:MAG: adenosylmethionine decarboxylase [Desulfomonilaceae bacterium]|nr:adenosylmethionine decarboxylase [Desulfomonilaceae bacterium]
MRRNKLKLRGFNNLTKSLSFNIYDLCYAKGQEDRKEYLGYIDEAYNSARLERILNGVADIIGARIINLSTQDYDPMGASVVILIAEDSTSDEVRSSTCLAHLDKSHICAHTYPETDQRSGISTFRVDIDVSTCGEISPLRSLNYLINSFDSEVVLLDYRVRGFTRDVRGKKLFIDHDMHSIQQFIAEDIKKRYDKVDINISQENLFHTKMILKTFRLDNYLFGTTSEKLNRQERQKVKDSLRREMTEIYYAKNLFR